MKTRRLISIILAVVFVITTALMLMPSSSADTLKVVYLDSTKGNDQNSGETTGKAVATLYAAFYKLANGGGIIDVVGDTIIDDPNLTFDMRSDTGGFQLEMPEHTGKIYITSTNGSKLIKTDPTQGTTISFFGDVEFYNITFESTASQNTNIYMYGNEITMGYGVDAIALAQNYCPRLFGYAANPEAGLEANPVINIYSGTFGTMQGAGTKGAKVLTGDVIINLYGGIIDAVNDGGPGGVTGNTTINVYNGTQVLTNIGTTGTVSGTRTLNLYNFTSAEEDALPIVADGFTAVNKGLTATVPTPDSDFITFTVETDDPNETTTAAPETTPEPEETTTKAPETTPDPEDTTTEAPETTTTAPETTGGDSDKKSCKSAVLSSLSLVLLAGSAYVALRKKRS